MCRTRSRLVVAFSYDWLREWVGFSRPTKEQGKTTNAITSYYRHSTQNCLHWDIFKSVICDLIKPFSSLVIRLLTLTLASCSIPIILSKLSKTIKNNQINVETRVLLYLIKDPLTSISHLKALSDTLKEEREDVTPLGILITDNWIGSIWKAGRTST